MRLAIARILLTRPHAAVTPKLGQDRKVAAILDALSRRGIRVTQNSIRLTILNDFVLDVKILVSKLQLPFLLIVHIVTEARVLLYFFHLNKFDYCQIQ